MLWNNGGFSLYRSPVKEPSLLSTFKNKLCLPQRHSVHFEQVPFQSVLTRPSYQRDADGQTAFKLYIVDLCTCCIKIFSILHFFSYCAGIVPDTFGSPLCSGLCWRNWWVPIHDSYKLCFLCYLVT